MASIDVFDLLATNNIIHVKVKPSFRSKLRYQIIGKYGSIKKFHRKNSSICKYVTLTKQLAINKYFKLPRLLNIASIIRVSKKEVYSNILSFIAHGTTARKEVVLPRKINIDNLFVEGFALYLAEGDNGSNGVQKPRKVRFTNSELRVINLFLSWLRKFFPHVQYYVKFYMPHDQEVKSELLAQVKSVLKVKNDQIKIKKERFKKKTKGFFRICADSAVLIDVVLNMERSVKNFVLQDKSLMCSYIRGMMIGEGTVYCKRMRYVRIEMRNENEIKFLCRLFQRLGFDVVAKERRTRPGIWLIYLGAPLLNRYAALIGFGPQEKRQAILKKASILYHPTSQMHKSFKKRDERTKAVV